MADTPVLIRLLYSPILGLLMLAGAAYLIVEQNQFRASAAAVEGEVIELIKTSTQDHDDVLLPKVRYVDKDGQEKTFIADNEGFITGAGEGRRKREAGGGRGGKGREGGKRHHRFRPTRQQFHAPLAFRFQAQPRGGGKQRGFVRVALGS